MLKKIIALLLSVLVIVTAFALPTFAAEDEVETVAEESYQYAMNLIPFPYTETSLTRNGVTFTVQEDGGVHVEGTATASTTFKLCGALYLGEGTYTVSGGVAANPRKGTDSIYVGARKLTAYGEDVYWIENKGVVTTSNTGDLTSGESVIYCIIYVATGSTVNGTVYPMLNIGTKAYPHMLYLPYLLEQQYNNGYTSGETAGSQSGYDQGYTEGNQAGYDEGYVEGEAAGSTSGYEQGYTEGNQAGYDKGYSDGYSGAMGEVESMTYGVFGKASFVATLTGSHPTSGDSYKKTFDFIPNFVFSGVFFSSLYDQINSFLISYGDENWDYVDRVEIEMVWINDDVFDYRVLPLYISGDFDVNFGTLYTTSGEAFELDASDYTTGEKRIFQVLTDKVDPLMVKRIIIRVGRPADLLTAFTLYSPSESYSDGYSDGYASGYIEGEDIGYINGGNAIYNEAYNKGKAEGLLLSEDGSWRALMLAVTEAPINTFQSLFNFEILGMDMRAAFGSIIAVCVVLIIVKKVVL